MGRAVDYAVGKEVVRRAPMRFVPSSGRFGTEAERDSEARADANDILRVPGAEERAPIHFRRRRIEQECGDGALQEGLQAGKSGLAELAEGDGFIRLKLFHPTAQIK